jgi:predicted aspartyl protease
VKKTIFLLVCAALIFQTDARGQRALISKVSNLNETSFQLAHGFLIVVPGSIGELENLRFILDTGVTRTVLNRKIADRLGRKGRPGQVFNLNRTVAVDSMTLPEIQFGTVTARELPVFVSDLSQFSEFARDADAVIGMDLLRLSNFTLDFSSRTIRYRIPELADSENPAEPIAHCVAFELLVQSHPVLLVLDTGAQGIILYENRILKHIPDLKTTGKVQFGVMPGRGPVRQVTLPGIRLGTRDVSSKVILVRNSLDNPLPEKFDGFLGISDLKVQRMDFNFSTNTFTLSWK